MNDVLIEILRVAKSIQRTGTQSSCSLSWLHFRFPGYQTRLRRTYIFAVASSTTNGGHRHSPCMYSKKTGYSPPGTSCRREKTKRRKGGKKDSKKGQRKIPKACLEVKQTGSETTKVTMGRKINYNLLRDCPKLATILPCFTTFTMLNEEIHR